MTFSPAMLHAQLPLDDSVRRIWVGLSGGLDSMVLLHALASLRLPLPVLALHINHQISPNANSWQGECAAVCSALNVPLVAEVVDVVRAGRGLEDAARAARYAVFEQHLQPGDLLLTAHHADDQAETLLLRLLRGAGPRGLAAMAPTRVLGAGKLCRPLLRVSRAELEAYAGTHQLGWVEDESNQDIHYDRNFLRQKVIPLLRERWPQLHRRLQQSAELCADSEVLLLELAAEDLGRCESRAERQGQSVSLAALRQFSLARRHNLLRHWLRQQGFDLPDVVHLQQIETQLADGRVDGEMAVGWGNISLHRYRERLYAVPRLATPEREQLHPIAFALTAQAQVLLLPDRGQMVFDYTAQVTDPGYLCSGLADLSLCWRQGGERCQPQGRAHSQTLKRLLQEYALEPWWRDHLPLIYAGDQLVAVGDLWVCKDFTAAEGQPGYRLRWQPGVV